MYGLLLTYFFACETKTNDTATAEPATDTAEEDSGEPSGTTDATVSELAAGDLIISEIQKNPCVLGADTDDDGNNDCTLADENGEWFEIYNNTSKNQNLNGLIVSDNSDDTERFVVDEDIIVPPQGYVVFGSNADTATNGGYTADFAYVGGDDGFKLSNGEDEIILSNASGVIDEVYYEDKPVFPDDKGYSLTLNPNALDATQNDDGANWCNAVTSFGDGDFGTPGEANSCE